jgi:hypothetical protein
VHLSNLAQLLVKLGELFQLGVLDLSVLTKKAREKNVMSK